MLIICASCGRRRTLERKPRGRLRCTVCKSVAVRVIRRIKNWMRIDDVDGVPEHEARMATFAGLRWYAAAKGYKPGWAARKFKTIYGVWPNGESVAEPEPPAGGLAHWINQQNAAYATAKRKERIMKENES